MPLTGPAWITAVAAVVIGVGVLIAAWSARQSLRAQREVTAKLAETLELQAKELRQSMDERRRAQACQVFIELERIGTPPEPEGKPSRAGATVHNASGQPIYDLYLIWQLGTVRMGRPDPTARLLPGRNVYFERYPEPGSNGTAPDASTLTAFLTFRDASGIRWTVREDGTLSDLAPNPRSEPADPPSPGL